MTKRFIALFAAGMLLITALSSCNTPEGETATMNSDSDSVTIQNTITDTEEKISRAEAAKPALSIDKFDELLLNPDLNAVAYEGTEDFIFSKEEHTAKTIIINTYGKAEINSSADEIIVLRADGGLTINADISGLIIKGDAVNTTINSSTSSVYIIGKDIKLSIVEGTVQTITVRNTTAMVYNHTKDDIKVVLTNGTNVTIPGKHTYSAKDNTLTKGILD